LGLASRREAETWISEGRVAVNGQIVREQGTKVTPGVDKLAINGKPIDLDSPPRVYWMLHKPDACLTARPDDSGKASIDDLPRLKKLHFLVAPVGRLDYRTEGLLLLTNDGEMAFRLAHPKFHVPRHYHVLVGGKLSREDEDKIRRGLELEDGPTGRLELRYFHGKNLGASRGSWYSITVHEGRNRLVRRVFEHLGYKVVRLLRVGFGDLRLPEDLAPGEYVQLSAAQIAVLKKITDLA
jgi:23S rRNA pseudouridine2605 synthase